MYLKQISIENFCSCMNLTVPLSDFTPIIGYNNAGKSNILRAILWLLRKSALPSSRFTDINRPVIISGVIANPAVAMLPQNQQTQIGRFVHNNTLQFRRIQDTPNVRATEIKLEVLDPSNGNWVANPTGIDNAISALFPEPIFIEAMDNASDDVSQFAAKNTIGLLLKNTMEQIRANNPQALTALTSALAAAANHLTGPQRIAEFALFEAAATTSLNDFFPGLSVHLSMQSPTLEDVVKTASIALSDAHGVKLGFNSYGHGTQRTVQMALVNLLANQLRSGAQGGSNTMLLIDEPELYLHPHAIELLRESLQMISQNQFQIVLTTHSPLIIGDRILDTAIATKDQQGHTNIRQKLASAAAALQNHPHHAAVVFSLQNSSFLLFSENVVIVEGKTEKMLVPEMYQVIRGKNLAKSKTCLIEVCGSNSIAPTKEILKSVGFNSKAIVDLDYLFRQAHNVINNFPNDPDFIACKNWFATNSQALGMSLAPDGFPQKNTTFTAASAFETMAAAIPQEVGRLAAQLIPQGFWVWTLGAIEAHLGIAKNDSARLNFISQMKQTQNLNHATDIQGLTNCMNWL